MDFRPLNDTERRQLINALRGNAESDRAILMDRRDTSFARHRRRGHRRGGDHRHQVGAVPLLTRSGQWSVVECVSRGRCSSATDH